MPVNPGVYNGGVPIRGLASLPAPATTEMLTVDAAGNMSRQAIPIASFAALTGSPSDNAALAAALAAKLGGSTGSNDNRILRADGTGGATAQSSAVTIDDSGNITGVGNLTVSNAGGGSGINFYNTNSQILLEVDYGLKISNQVNRLTINNGSNGTLVAANGTFSSNVTASGIVRGGGGSSATPGVQIMDANQGFYVDNGCVKHKTNGGEMFATRNAYSITGAGFPSDRVLFWASDTNSHSAADIVAARNSAGQLDVRADNGLRLRNLANSDFTAIQAGAITANGLIQIPSTGSGRRFLAYGVESGYSGAFTEVNSYGAVGITAASLATSDPGYSLFGGMITGDTYNRLAMELVNGSPALGFGSGSGSRDGRVIRNSSGQLDIRGDNGLRIRNLANSADAALQSGAITASGLTSIDHTPTDATEARLIQIRRGGSDRFAVGLSYNYDNYFGDPGGVSFGRSQYGNGYLAIARSAQLFVWANTGVQLKQGLYYGISGSSFDQVTSGWDTADVKLSRGGTGPTWDMRSAGGLKVRNLANSADAPLTCGAITASGNITGGTFITSGAVATSGGADLALQANSITHLIIRALSGNVGIGQTNPSVGLVIRRSGTDLPALRLEDGDITVPFTGLSINPTLNANTVGGWSAAASSGGGCAFNGFTNGASGVSGLYFAGYLGTTTPNAPALYFTGNKSNGSTGAADLTGSELIAGFYPGNSASGPVVTIAANGAITHGFQTLTANPTTSDIASGLVRVVKNSTSGELRLWANDGGTMKSVLFS